MSDDDIVLPYNEEWAAMFAAERERLLAVLGPWLSTDIEHVGSTSVPGMAAKPVIDMLAGVHDLHAARQAMSPLAALNYAYRPHRPEALLFDRPRSAAWQDHTHHLHLTEPGSDLWRERLAFRDALREDPELVAEYSEWKRRHRLAGPDGPYDASKTPFVARVLARSGIPLKPDGQRRSPDADRSNPNTPGGRPRQLSASRTGKGRCRRYLARGTL